MKWFRRLLLGLVLAQAGLPVAAQEHSAEQLLAGVKAARPSGGIYARLRLAHRAPGAAKAEVLQVQVKRRIADSGRSEHLYQVLFPADRKGEGVLLKIAGSDFSGATASPTGEVTALQASDRDRGLFGTALSVEDVIAEFLEWPSPKWIGSEAVGNVPCHIVDSLAPAGSKSSVKRVRSWIDAKRFVTQKMEVYGANDAQPMKTVLTEKVLRNKTGYYLPVAFTVTDAATGAATTVEGVRSDSGLTFADADFAESALGSLTTPPAP